MKYVGCGTFRKVNSWYEIEPPLRRQELRQTSLLGLYSMMITFYYFLLLFEEEYIIMLCDIIK